MMRNTPMLGVTSSPCGGNTCAQACGAAIVISSRSPSAAAKARRRGRREGAVCPDNLFSFSILINAFHSVHNWDLRIENTPFPKTTLLPDCEFDDDAPEPQS